MGGMTSKMVEDVLNDKPMHTPKTKQIPFDPRSPSDNISRTPITRLDTPERRRDETPKDSRIVSVVDPRSPNVEVDRTPIVIEKKEAPRRPLSLKPTCEMKLDSFLCGPNDDIAGENEQDPRSPTIKVPRTPLEDKVIELEVKDNHSEVNDENRTVDSNAQENTGKQVQENTLVKKLFTSEGQTEKIRRPLVVLQNSNAAKTPRDILQAKHCRNVEDEYNKNIQCLLPDQEITVQSNTEFIEDI